MYQVISPLGIQYPVLSCRVRRHGNEHEIVRVSVRGLHDPLNEPALAAGAPITVRYGASALNLYNFYGYVSHTEPHALQNGSYTDVVCIGPTRICKAAAARTFLHRTIPGILGDTFNRSSIGFFSDKNTQKWATQSQLSTQSDWAFAVALAQQIGFMLVPEGAVVRGHDPVKVLSTAPPLLVRNATTFEPVVAAQGSVHTGSTYARQVIQTTSYAIGADPPTILGTYSGVAPQGTVTTIPSPAPACLGEARALAQGAALSNVWVHQATLTMPGDTRLKPGGTIDLEISQYAGYAGLWAVLQVDHTLVGQNVFNTKLLLGRDTFGPVQVRPPSTPLPKSDGVTTKNIPGTVWRNNQWMVQWNVRSN